MVRVPRPGLLATRMALAAALVLPAVLRDGPPVAARPRSCARRADVAACPAESRDLRMAAARLRDAESLLGAPHRQRRTVSTHGVLATSAAASIPTSTSILPVLVHEPGITPAAPRHLPDVQQPARASRPPPLG